MSIFSRQTFDHQCVGSGMRGLLGVLAGALALALVVLTVNHVGRNDVSPLELLEKLKAQDDCDAKCQSHKDLVAKQSALHYLIPYTSSMQCHTSETIVYI